MNIDPLSNYGLTHRSLNRPSGNGPANTGNPSADGKFEHLSAELSNSIREIFASKVEVRPEVVARGRELLADPSYPSQEIVERIAALVTPLPED